MLDRLVLQCFSCVSFVVYLWTYVSEINWDDDDDDNVIVKL